MLPRQLESVAPCQQAAEPPAANCSCLSWLFIACPTSVWRSRSGCTCSTPTLLRPLSAAQQTNH